VARLLVVTAVAAERDALNGDFDVIVGGVGPAEAAAATARALVTGGYDRVLSAGIGGGFGVEPGTVVLASSIVFADLGAETEDGFTPLDELGFGRTRYDVDPAVYAGLEARAGTILTVSTVTGTAATAARLRRRHPDAVAEGMEGAGVAAAAAAAGIAFGEVRAISNAVGPRDRAAWRVPEALTALAAACASITV
jgi:futalosine hydrolase